MAGLHNAIIAAQGHRDDASPTVFLSFALGCEISSSLYTLLLHTLIFLFFTNYFSIIQCKDAFHALLLTQEVVITINTNSIKISLCCMFRVAGTYRYKTTVIVQEILFFKNEKNAQNSKTVTQSALLICRLCSTRSSCA